MDEDTIWFYDKADEFVRQEHIILNNFELSPFKDENGLDFPSAEAYYQAHKFDNFDDGEIFKTAFEEIRTAENGDLCKKAARKYEKETLNGKWLKDRWEGGYKDYIMRRGLMFKYSQNLAMLDTLVSTGTARVAERSPRDPYWGGLLPNSLNKLGLFLMELRDNYAKDGKIFLADCGLDPIEVKKE